MSKQQTTEVATFNPRPPAGLASSQATLVEQSRAIAEVQAAVVVAQQCPRDMSRAEGEMVDACGRTALAERAFYAVPNRGSGPSVHLARELARIWGNVQYGVKETHRDDATGVSEILAYAWDVQTNTRSERSFIVPHARMVTDRATKKQERRPLIDLADIYLNNQNVGARAVRECIFTVLPTWFTEAAQDVCNKTLRDGDGKPLGVRIEEMVSAFAATFGVDLAGLEYYLGKRRGQWDAGDLARARIAYTSLNRREIAVDEFTGGRQTATAETFTQSTEPEVDTAVAEPTLPVDADLAQGATA